MEKEKKNLLVFGYGLTVIITFIVWRHSAKHHVELGIMSYMALGLAVFFAVITTIDYRLLRAFYARWMKVAHFIGMIVSGALLCLLFFLVFAVTGIIMRLLRKDLLDCRIDKESASYWIKRPTGEIDLKRYLQQF